MSNINTEPSSESVEENLMHRSSLKTLFLQPAVFIATLTAVIGPVTLAYLSNANEQAQLRTTVLAQVLSLTSGANFDKESEILRAGVISSMVNENQSKFGLSLDKSEQQFKQLAESLRIISTKALTDQIADQKARISSLSTEVDGYKSSITKNNERVHEIDSKVKQLELNREANKGLIQNLRDEKDKLDKASSNLMQVLATSEAQAKEANLQLQSARNDLNSSDKRVQSLLTENTKAVQDLEIYKANISSQSDSITDLKAKLSSAIDSAAQMKTQVESLSNSLNSAKEDYKQQKERADSLELRLSEVKCSSISGVLSDPSTLSRTDQTAVGVEQNTPIPAQQGAPTDHPAQPVQ